MQTTLRGWTTPEQRIGFLKELLGNLKKDIGEAKGRPRAVTAEDARILAEGGRYSELKHCVDREGLLARLEQESLEPTPRPHERRSLVSIVTEAPITGVAWEPIMRDLNATWQADFEPECRKRLELRKPGCPESEKREYLEIKKQEYLKVRKGEILKIERQRARELLELAPRYWAARDRQREDEQAWQMSHRFWAAQRLLITKLDEARLDEAKREETRAPAPPQPVPQEPAEPEDAQDTSETKGSKTTRKLDELDGLLDTITKDIQSTEIGRVWDVIKSELRKEKLERRKYDSTGILLQWNADNYRRTFIWRKADPKARNGYREVPCSKETLSRKRLYLLRKNSHR